MRKFLPLAAATFLAAASAEAADVTVLGCNEMRPGEIGVRDFVADIGDAVEVAVTVSTTGPVGAFSLDIAYPTSLLSFVGWAPGDLLGVSWSFDAFQASPGIVRMEGLEPTGTGAVPAGSAGRLVMLRFEAIGAGAGTFATVSHLEDLAGYSPCESGQSPTKVLRRTWGAVKELYR